MATLARGGRITTELVDEEIQRLRDAWHPVVPLEKPRASRTARVLGESLAATLDRFDLAQLEEALAVVEGSPSLSEAGRRLFAESRKTKSSSNDADRLRKYLARFALTFAEARAALTPGA
jgi:transcriptional regulatory protein RtcR